MADEDFEKRARQFVTASQSNIDRITQALWYAWYQRLPIFFGGTFTSKGLAWGALYFVSYVAVATAPIWTEYFVKGEISWTTALTFSFIVLGFMTLRDVSDRLGRRRAARDAHHAAMENFATRHYVIMDEVAKAVSASRIELAPDRRILLAENTLQCMVQLACMILEKSATTYIQANLLLFDGENCKTARVAARAFADRRRDVEVESRQTIAFYVAETGVHFAVNDIKAQGVFPAEGLSEKKLKYRSILLVPVHLPNSIDKVCGVVTIDSALPYEFAGAVGDRLYTQLMPFVRVLGVLFEAQGQCLEVNT